MGVLIRVALVEVALDEVAPVEVTPVEVAPDEVAPVEVAPDEVAPVEVAPDEVAPVRRCACGARVGGSPRFRLPIKRTEQPPEDYFFTDELLTSAFCETWRLRSFKIALTRTT